MLAAGVWSAALRANFGCLLPLQPAKGYSITVTRPDGVPPQMPLYLPEGHVCVTPYDERLRLAGTLELSGINVASSPIVWRASAKAPHAS